MNYVIEYINKIESGNILVSEKVKRLYLNIIKPIINDEHPLYYFNEKRGERFIRFAESFCKQSKAPFAGKKLKLMLFQKAKWQCIYGILRRETNIRRFQEIFDVRARKNGKSTENAVVGLYSDLENHGAEIYVAATVSSQARRVWEESQSMIDQSKELQKVLGY
jgi:phage terminase large subunit-like protein